MNIARFGWRDVQTWAEQMCDSTGMWPTHAALGGDVRMSRWSRLVCRLYLGIRIEGGSR